MRSPSQSFGVFAGLVAFALVGVASATADLVATLPAEVSVDNKGSANLSIPLKISPGRGGMAPALSLNYSSQSGNGPLGIGWSVATGFPQAITRGRTILARDGLVKGVTFDDTNSNVALRDRFYLDGKRLICVSGDYGAVNSVYRTEVDSFVTVVASGTSSIETFVVTDKSGTRMTFGKLGSESDGYQTGTGGDNNLAYTYALKRVEDAIGNYVKFTYQDMTGGEFVLQKIDYTGGTSITPAASVEFSYGTRDDKTVTWVTHRRFQHYSRLATITAKHGSTTTATYSLNYDYAPNGTATTSTYSGRSRLRSIAPSLADPTSGQLQAVPATSFDWIAPVLKLASNPLPPTADPASSGDADGEYYWMDQNQDGKDEYRAVPSSPGAFAPNLTYKVSGDLDADGKTEIYEMNYLGLNGTLTSNAQPISIAFGNVFRDPGLNSLLLAELEGAGITSRISIADFTGDGRADILAHGYDGYFYLYESTGTGVLPAAKSQYPAGAPNVVATDDWEFFRGYIVPFIGQHHFVRPMPCDLNGDGRMDYVFTQNTRTLIRVNGTIHSYMNARNVLGVLSLPGGGFTKVFTVNPNLPVNVSDSHPAVFSEVYSGAIPGDFNGDGLTDFLCLDNKLIYSQRWLLLLSKGEYRNGYLASGDPTDISMSFEMVFGPIPNTVTIAGEQVPAYFKPVTDAKWAQIVSPASSPLGITYGKLFAAIEGANGSLSAFIKDVNGDGLDDYVWYAHLNASDGVAAGKGWYAMLSTGNFSTAVVGAGFSGPVALPGFNNNYGGEPCTISSGPTFNSVQVITSMDTDGDGHQDYFIRNVATGKPVSGVSTGTVKQARGADGVSPAPFAGLIWGVTDGFGRRTEIAYRAAKDAEIYTPGAPVSYPIRELRAATPVVSDVWHDSGVTGSPSHFSYQYSGNRTDFSGRGSLGFHSFVTLDEQTGLFRYQFLAQSFPMTGLTHREETYRWWNEGDQDKFRYITSHDNVVVFDKVATAGGATLWPFIAKAVEYRWENSPTAHASFTEAAANAQPENLFSHAKPPGAHITISAESTFDNQSGPKLTLPPSVTGYNPSDLNGSTNVVTGTTTFATFSGLPGDITCGNLKRLKTDFGDGFSETVDTFYFPATSNGLSGLVDNVATTVVSPLPYGTETAPTKRYTYWTSGLTPTPLVADETVDATDNALDLKTTYTRDGRGRVTNTQITNTVATGLRAIGDYSVSSASAFNDNFDLPTATANAAPYSHGTTTVYHSFLGLPASVTDVNGAQVTTTYDALGRTKKVIDALGRITEYDYLPDTTQTVMPPSGVGGLSLSSKYRITVTATVQPPVTTYYDRLGRAIRTIKDGFSGQVYTDTVYNVLGQVVAVSNPYPAGGTKYWTTTTYDALGRVATVTAPNGTVTTNTYRGRITQVSVDAADLGGVNPAAQVNSTEVDAKGRTVKVWNNDNQPTLTLLPGSDVAATSNTEASIAFALDGFGRMRTTTLKGQSQTISATYDALGRQTALNDPDKGDWTYINNALGQVVYQLDAAGNATESSFDRLGRPLLRKTTSGSVIETADFFYYDTGSLSGKPNTVPKGTQGWIGAPQREEADTTGAPGFEAPKTVNLHYYDAKGRPALELAKTDDKWFYTATLYDEVSRPVQVRHYWKPANAELPSQQPYVWQDFGYTYTYDGNLTNSKSYLIALTDSLGRSWWEANPVGGYDHLDRPVKVRKGSGFWTQRTNRPTDGVLTGIATGQTLGSSDLQDLTFSYDGLGNLRFRGDTAVSGGTESFVYDNLNRLTAAGNNGVVGYFSNGNIQTKNDVLGTASGTYSYNAGAYADATSTTEVRTLPHAVASAFGYTFKYDLNGNLLKREKAGDQSAATWTGFDKPRTMWRVTPAKVAGSEFHYNAARSRVLQLEFDEVSGTFPSQAPAHYNRKRVYALGSTLELNYKNAILSGSGVNWQLDTVRIYVPGPDGIIGAREFWPASGGSEKALVYHYDHLGSITAITDHGSISGASIASGNKTGRYSGDAWGQRRDPHDWSGAPTSATDDGGADSLTPRGFTGHEMLDELGLVHMNGRINDPLLGRFLSADRMVQAPGNLQSYNRYSYVFNNPLSYTDPSGDMAQAAWATGTTISAAKVGFAAIAITLVAWKGDKVTRALVAELQNRREQILWARAERAAQRRANAIQPTAATGELPNTQKNDTVTPTEDAGPQTTADPPATLPHENEEYVPNSEAASAVVETFPEANPADIPTSTGGPLPNADVILKSDADPMKRDLVNGPHAPNRTGTQIADRARSTGNPQGQWTTEQAVRDAAAQADMSKPVGVAQPITVPDGSATVTTIVDGKVVTIPTNNALAIPRADGTVHVYPVLPPPPPPQPPPQAAAP